MAWVAAGTAIVGLGASIYTGIKQKAAAKKLAASNTYPTETVPQAALDNQQQAIADANTGLPAQQYAQAMKNIGRQQQTAIRMANDRRAGVGLIGQIQQNSDDAAARLGVADAQARLQNKRNLYAVNNRVAGYQNDAFNWNSKNKYNQDYNYSQQLEGAGNANLMHGVDVAGSAAIGLVKMQQAKKANGLYGNAVDNSHIGDSSWYGSDPLPQ